MKPDPIRVIKVEHTCSINKSELFFRNSENNPFINIPFKFGHVKIHHFKKKKLLKTSKILLEKFDKISVII